MTRYLALCVILLYGIGWLALSYAHAPEPTVSAKADPAEVKSTLPPAPKAASGANNFIAGNLPVIANTGTELDDLKARSSKQPQKRAAPGPSNGYGTGIALEESVGRLIDPLEPIE